MCGAVRNATIDPMSGEVEVKTLAAGAKILGPVLEPAGFVFQPGAHAKGAGGPFGDGRFIRGDQYVELHFRHSPGMVSDECCGATVSHEDYLRDVEVKGAYPGFSEDPLDGFRHLAQDIAGPLAGFIAGDRPNFDAAVVAAAEPKNRLP